MSDPSSQRVTCPGCGKGYRWQDKLVDRIVPCKQCDTQFTVPHAPGLGLVHPPAGDGTYDLDYDPKQETRQLAKPAVGGKCPSCNSPVKEHAVICINCGFDMQHGRQMARPEIAELDPAERKAGQREAKAPIRGMALVRAGLWLNFASIVLVILTVPVGIIDAILTINFELITDILVFFAFGCTMLGALLCLAAPKESKGRPILMVSIALSVIASVLTLIVEIGAIAEGFTYLAEVISIAGTACFLYFFVMLANYLDFPEIVERAEKVLGLYVMVQLGLYVLLLPVIGCFMVLIVLGAAIYTLVLYVLLLIDLNNALSYRIGEQKAEYAV